MTTNVTPHIDEMDRDALRELLLTREREHLDLVRRVAGLEEQLRRTKDSANAAARRAADLASLYVAIHRLHSTLDRGRVLQALEEIVAALLGCEQLAVFELVGTPAVLAPLMSVGLLPGEPGLVTPGEGRIGACATEGRIWTAEAGVFGGDGLTACVPLLADGDLVGVLALFRLLEHKERLEAADGELLEVLSVHAGTALLATRLKVRSREAS